jgi:CheY-like chemotaxis protein
MLTDEVYTVLTADGGMRALEIMRQWPGHAVVMLDYLMPQGDGLDILRAVADDGRSNVAMPTSAWPLLTRRGCLLNSLPV